MHIRALLAFAFVLGAAPALASEDVTISTAATSGGTLSGGVFTPTADDAVLNVTELQNALATQNVRVTTGTTGTQHGSITVATLVAWSVKKLALDAHKSVILTANLRATGTAGLTVKVTHASDFILDGGRVTFGNTSEALTIAATAYTLVNDIPTLATDISGNASGAYALAGNYDAATGPSYIHPPITTAFTGMFEGLGNRISNLTVLDTSNEDVALFSSIGSGGTVRDLTLLSMTISSTPPSTSSNVGGLAVTNGGLLYNISVDGQVTQGTRSTSAGGLVAQNQPTGTIMQCLSSVVVSGGATLSDAGGLTGANAGLIENSSATGNVTDNGQQSLAGGLSGRNDGTITQSFATGAVSGTSSFQSAGGLVGGNTGAISEAYATGNVSTGDQTEAGGLVGDNVSSAGSATISNSYATGSVSAGLNGNAGGLIGEEGPHTAVSSSYSTGVPSATGASPHIGGVVGFEANPGSFGNVYWDTTTSGITNLAQGAGNVTNDAGLTGLSDTVLKSGLPTGFSASIWAESGTINGGLPYLQDLPPS